MPVYIDPSRERDTQQAGKGGFYTALQNLNSDPLALPDLESQPSAARYVTVSRYAGLTNGSVLSTGVPTLVPIWLPAGLVVTNVVALSATTAAG